MGSTSQLTSTGHVQRAPTFETTSHHPHDGTGRRNPGGPLFIPGHGAGTNLERRHGYGRGMSLPYK
jgi:hypothetical protein